jgi:hypothetical protein
MLLLVPTYIHLLKDEKGKGRGNTEWDKNGHLRPHGSLYVICIAKLLAGLVQ